MTDTKTKVAVFIRDNFPNARFGQALFRVDPPLPDWPAYDEDGTKIPRASEYVIVSKGRDSFDEWETFIFPARPDGTIIDLREMPGSMRRYFRDYGDLLEQLGYHVCPNEAEYGEPHHVVDLDGDHIVVRATYWDGRPEEEVERVPYTACALDEITAKWRD